MKKRYFTNPDIKYLGKYRDYKLGILITDYFKSVTAYKEDEDDYISMDIRMFDKGYSHPILNEAYKRAKNKKLI